MRVEDLIEILETYPPYLDVVFIAGMIGISISSVEQNGGVLNLK